MALTPQKPISTALTSTLKLTGKMISGKKDPAKKTEKNRLSVSVFF